MDKYVEFKNQWYCREHHVSFLVQCPQCKTPSFHVENQKVPGKVSPKSTEQNRTTPNKHRRVSKKSLVRFRDTSIRIYERFHSYRLRFDAVVDWVIVPGEELCLSKNNMYKRIDYPEAIVKVFKRSIFVIMRSNKEIKGLSVVEAKARADAIIRNVIDGLPRSIRVMDDPKVKSLHNAFVNHPFAKDDTTVTIDGENRWISDKSNGRMEFEAVSPVFAVEDSKVLERFMIDLNTKPSYPPSVLSAILDTVLGVQVRYADQIEKHLKVQDATLDVMGGIKDTMVDMRDVLRGGGVVLHDSRNVINTSSPLPKDYRLFRAQQLLSEWGW